MRQGAQRLQKWFYDPYEKVLNDIPQLRENRPFEYVKLHQPPDIQNDICSIKIKQMVSSYHVEKVIKDDIPRLQHGNDGLIYTCAESGYVVGTDQRMYVLHRFPFVLII